MPLTYTYSGNPADNDLDEVRFLLGDTDVSNPPTSCLFADGEIDYAIAKWGPIYASNLFTASVLAMTAAAQYAQNASYSADGVSVSLGPVGDQLRALAASLRLQWQQSTQAGVLPSGGGATVWDVPDPDVRTFMFGIGMDDDPAAEPQDFGGINYDAASTQWNLG